MCVGVEIFFILSHILNDNARQLSLRYKEKGQDFSKLGRKFDDKTANKKQIKIT